MKQDGQERCANLRSGQPGELCNDGVFRGSFGEISGRGGGGEWDQSVIITPALNEDAAPNRSRVNPLELSEVRGRKVDCS